MNRIFFYGAVGIGALLFFYTMHMVIYGTPLVPSKELYINQKIFYYHVPQAFLSFTTVIVCGVAALLFLRKRQARFDDVAQAAGELAVIFGIMMLASGSIWGKASWGVWWTWDARLTTSLLLWLLMVGYVIVRRYGGAGAERLAAGLAVFGMADIPLIYFSVKIWESQHPKTSVVPELTGTMSSTLWISVLLFHIVFVILLIARVGQLRAERHLRETREAALDAGILD